MELLLSHVEQSDRSGFLIENCNFCAISRRDGEKVSDKKTPQMDKRSALAFGSILDG